MGRGGEGSTVTLRRLSASVVDEGATPTSRRASSAAVGGRAVPASLSAATMLLRIERELNHRRGTTLAPDLPWRRPTQVTPTRECASGPICLGITPPQRHSRSPRGSVAGLESDGHTGTVSRRSSAASHHLGAQGGRSSPPRGLSTLRHSTRGSGPQRRRRLRSVSGTVVPCPTSAVASVLGSDGDAVLCTESQPTPDPAGSSDGSPAASGAALARSAVLRALAKSRSSASSAPTPRDSGRRGTVRLAEILEDYNSEAKVRPLHHPVRRREWAHAAVGNHPNGVPRVEKVEHPGIDKLLRHAVEIGMCGLDAACGEATVVTVAHGAARYVMELDRHCRVNDIRTAFAELTARSLGDASASAAVRVLLRGRELLDDEATVFEQGVTDGCLLEAALLPAPQLMRWSTRLSAVHTTYSQCLTHAFEESDGAERPLPTVTVRHAAAGDGGAVAIFGPAADHSGKRTWLVRIDTQPRRYCQHIGVSKLPPEKWLLDGFDPNRTDEAWVIEDDGTQFRPGRLPEVPMAGSTASIGWGPGDLVRVDCDSISGLCTVAAGPPPGAPGPPQRQWVSKLPTPIVSSDGEVEEYRWYLVVHLLNRGSEVSVSLQPGAQDPARSVLLDAPPTGGPGATPAGLAGGSPAAGGWLSTAAGSSAGAGQRAGVQLLPTSYGAAMAVG